MICLHGLLLSYIAAGTWWRRSMSFIAVGASLVFPKTDCAYLLTIHCQRDGLLSLCVVWGERFVGALCVVWGQRFKEITKLNGHCLLKIASDTNDVELNKYISVHRIMQLSSSFLTLCLAKQDDYIVNRIITFLIYSVYPITLSHSQHFMLHFTYIESSLNGSDGTFNSCLFVIIFVYLVAFIFALSNCYLHAHSTYPPSRDAHNECGLCLTTVISAK